MIAIVDYGLGNLGSVLNMLKKLGIQAIISEDVSTIDAADKLILPGVGAFDNGIKNITEKGLLEVLRKKVIIQKTPVLGICLGVQLFAKRSEEGTLPGLGWIDAEVIHFRFSSSQNKIKIPHMGWNEIVVKRENPLLSGFEEQPRFYFVHSYYLDCNNSEDVIATSNHGIEFAAAINRENIWGTQFHPEKSHKYGLRVMKNFCAL